MCYAENLFSVFVNLYVHFDTTIETKKYWETFLSLHSYVSIIRYT